MTESLTDLFTTIATRALHKGGVDDPAWIAAVADEHRRAFAQLGVVVPPGGLVELETTEPIEPAPQVVTPAEGAGPTAAPEPAPLPPQVQALQLLSMLETERLWVLHVDLFVHDGNLVSLMQLHQSALYVTWSWHKRTIGEVWRPRIERIVFPQAGATFSELQYTWLRQFTFSRPLLEQTLQQELDRSKDSAAVRGPYWDQVRTVVPRS